ncbi:SulP family inorganic anion transporter [Neptunomonas sp.]|uniref:SulP family inorganic anion transporter n=1 Tax=Neptunomonas sp. TaxID=1971898 RepID=UPI0025D64491|nr:SulP family inorganic anion transporter [Neptunomonas sp.]
MQWLFGLHFNNFKGDLFGGLTAAVVALPLALAFGVSSGAGPVAGMYGAIFVGLFAALFGGTPSQVSGPTGPMTVVMAGIFTHFVSLDPVSGPAMAFTVVMLGGAFQILFGVFRLGQFITLMPFPVISGFMTGIGTIIILLQLPPLLGAASEANVLSVVNHLPVMMKSINLNALLLGLVTLGIVFFCPKSIKRYTPPALLALIAGTAFSFALNVVDTIGEIPTGLPSIHWPEFEVSLVKDMLISSLILATLGSIDSLLTSLVADNMTRTQHKSDRELIGQGIGNIVAGFFGGLPGAGATMRTVVNIRAGGRTPISGCVHAIILLSVVLGAGSFAAHIPLAVLAGILIKVGIDIIDWRFLMRIHQAPLFVIFLMVTVWGLTVFVDLITAVAAGVFLANIYTVKRLSETQLESVRIIQDDKSDHHFLSEHESNILIAAGGRILLYQLNGPLSYAAAKGISNKLMACTNHEILLLDFSNVPHIDVSTAMALEEVILDSHLAAQNVLIVGAKPEVETILHRMRVATLIPNQFHFPNREAALNAASVLLTVPNGKR